MAKQMDPDDLNAKRIVTVFGETGFLGRWIVKRLLERGFTVRAASRHPRRGMILFPRRLVDSSTQGGPLAGICSATLW
jgi:NADH dehydrogenase